MHMQVIIKVSDNLDNERLFNAMKEAASKIGMNILKRTQLMTAASELLSNIIQYSGTGEMTIHTTEQNGRWKITVVAKACGQGVADLKTALNNGFSTDNLPGLGLPGAKALSDEFKVDVIPGVGRTVTISKWA
jgi:serine/threonine-protein kinase RsbT